MTKYKCPIKVLVFLIIACSFLQKNHSLLLLIKLASEWIVCSIDTSPRFRSDKLEFLLPSNFGRVTSNGGID